ncbi:MAG: M20/M25/M40 family metallo-hydrolase [Vicinamibacterales bacterium]
MRRTLVLTFLLAFSATTLAQSPVDLGTVARIKQEALTTSKAMDHVSWLADVYGPRVTGTPQFQQASDWAMARFREWGLANVHQERFAFGQGWRVERFSAHMIEPQTQPIVGFPRLYSPRTNGPVTAEVVRVDIRSDADFQKYAGKLRGRIVLPQGARAVRLLDGRVTLRMNDGDVKEALSTPIPPPAPASRPAPRPGQPTFAERLAKFYVDEGVVALVERGSESDLSAGGSDLTWMTQRVDGGTVFPGTGGSRDPKVAAPVPSATIAVEHYNRILRILDKGTPVKLELNIQTTFYPENASAPNGINTIAEIPGTDLAQEVVMIGAHLDSHAYATGATDNATGVAAMMETVRVISALGLKPRRTIRIALWAGEEQGLLGSRAYVAEHFGNPADNTAKPAHTTLAAYFNLDNGTGKIRGIWGQGNLGAMAQFRSWMEAVSDLGVDYVGPRSVVSTDHVPFDTAGLPGFQFMQERLDYNSRTHHSTMDFLDHVQRDDLVQQATVAAVFTWYAANTTDKLPRKPAVKSTRDGFE